MNRRQALLAVLAAPAGYSQFFTQGKQTNGGYTRLFSNATRLVISLNDKEVAEKEAGMYELEVTYAGKKIVFTAKEIWEALQP